MKSKRSSQKSMHRKSSKKISFLTPHRSTGRGRSKSSNSKLFENVAEKHRKSTKNHLRPRLSNSNVKTHRPRRRTNLFHVEKTPTASPTSPNTEAESIMIQQSTNIAMKPKGKRLFSFTDLKSRASTESDSSGDVSTVIVKRASDHQPSIRDSYKEVRTLIESVDTTVSNKPRPKRQSLAYRKSASPRHSLYMFEKAVGDNTPTITIDSTQRKRNSESSKNQKLKAQIAQITRMNEELKEEIKGNITLIQLRDEDLVKKTEIIEDLEQLTAKFKHTLARKSDGNRTLKQEHEELRGKFFALEMEMDTQCIKIKREVEKNGEYEMEIRELKQVKKDQAKQIIQMRHQLDKQNDKVENLKKRSKMQSMNANEMETKLRKSKRKSDQSEKEIAALHIRMDEMKLIVKESVHAQQMNKKNMEKVDQLSKEVRRLSKNESKMLRRQSNEVIAFEKEIFCLKTELEERDKAIDELQRKNSNQQKNMDEMGKELAQDWKSQCIQLQNERREKVSDLKIAQKENQRLLQQMREQDKVMQDLSRKSFNLNEREMVISDAMLEKKENEIKKLQIEIIDKNIDLERFANENDELLRTIEMQHEKMTNKDEKLQEIKSALDEMLVERDRLIGEIKEIKRGLSSKRQPVV